MILVLMKASISSFLATLSFAILFNIKRDKLFYAGLTGLVGGVLYKVCLELGYGEYISNFIGAFSLSVCSEVMARKCKAPVTVFLVCALIPLVPGGYLYHTMNAAMNGQTQMALVAFMTMMSIAIVLSTAILIVSTIFRIYSKYKSQRFQTMY